MPAPAAPVPVLAIPTPDHPPGDYEWDVFLSYADSGYPGAWVRNTFHELLVKLVATEVHNPRIFSYRRAESVQAAARRIFQVVRE